MQIKAVNCAKLSSFTHKMVVLFGNVWHTECSCETYLLCVGINQAPSHMIIICVCLYMCLIIHGPPLFPGLPYGFSVVQMICVKMNFPWHEF